MNEERPLKVVWDLAWPAVTLNLMQVANAFLDSLFVGHLDKASVTAYGGMPPVLFMMFSLAMTAGTAATALVSRAFGAGDIAGYKMSSRQCSSLAWLAGLVFAVICFLTAEPAANLLMPESAFEAKRLMADFIRIYAIGLPPIYLVQALAGSLRGAGDTKSPMMISGFTILTHMALNLVLINETLRIGNNVIHTAGLGLNGAAYALSGSAWISAAVYVFYARRTAIGRQNPLTIPQIDWVRRILAIAGPASVMAVLRVGSLTAFQLSLKFVPNAEVAIAALRPAFAIESVMFMPAFAFSMAAAALVGQSLGMKDPERAARLGWTAAHMGAIITLVMCVPVFVLAPSISALQLGNKPLIIEESVRLLRTLCTTEIFFSYAMVLIGAMQGAGDTRSPLKITVVNLWMLRVPLAFLLSLAPGVLAFVPWGLGLGAFGAWLSMAITQATQGLMAMALFKGGQWKLAKV